MLKSFDLILIAVTLGILVFGCHRRMRLWSVGTAEDRSGDIRRRVVDFLKEGVLHSRILEDRFPGGLHLLVFLGFLIPLAIVLITQVRFTLPSGISKPLSLLLDLTATAALVSVAFLIYRRYLRRPDRLDNRPEDLAVLALLALILLSGALMEGLRLSIIGRDTKAWAPLGYGVAGLVNLMDPGPETRALLALLVYRIHVFAVLGLIAAIPFTKLFHLITSPMSMIFRSLGPRGPLPWIDLEDEDAETFGVSKIEEFHWKHLLDLDACTRCGRCQDHCPAYRTQKPLSPKSLIQDLKSHFRHRAPTLLAAKRNETEPEDIDALVGSVIPEDVLWSCTTCRSCMEHCPVHIEHIDKIIEMRRYQVLMESRFPEELTQAFKNLERNSNPWGMGFDSRADWIAELDVPVMADLPAGEDLDFLFYVGCIRSYDDRNKKVAAAMTRLLNAAGVKFAILGMEEGCCGDPARRVGNEYLYQMLAQSNIETLKRYNVKKVMTTCPHCFNTLKYEYPQQGLECEVLHHSQFLKAAFEDGRLKPAGKVDKRVTYHDPCYLGRYSGLFSPPRKVLETLLSGSVLEMARGGRDAFCCGAGGGWMWMDEKLGQRINIQRLEDASSTGATEIATACPFCVTMFNDAIKDTGQEETLRIWDIAELALQAVSPDEKSHTGEPGD